MRLFFIIAIILLASCYLPSCTNKGDNMTAPPILDSGTVCFYSDNNSGYPIDLQTDGMMRGTINTPLGNATCGDNGSISMKQAIGSHSYSAFMRFDKLWQGNYTVAKDSCTRVLLSKAGMSSLIDATPVDSFFRFTLNNVPLSIKYPWTSKLGIDGYVVGGNGTACDPLFQTNNVLKIFVHNTLRSYGYSVPPAYCSAGPGETFFSFVLRMNQRPVVGQQYSSCNSTMRFTISLDNGPNYYGYYGVEAPGDYINLRITEVTGMTVSGTFEGSLTRYKTVNCQKIVTGRGVFTNGSFKLKYRY